MARWCRALCGRLQQVSARSVNFLLQLLAGLLCLCAVIVLIIGLNAPMIQNEPEQHPDAHSSPVKRGPIAAGKLIHRVFARSFQPHQASVTAPQGPAPADGLVPISQLILVGTVGNSLALIKGPDGSIGMVETGEDVNGSPVIAIRPSEVDLRVNGKLTTLRMPPRPDDSAIVHAR